MGTDHEESKYCLSVHRLLKSLQTRRGLLSFRRREFGNVAGPEGPVDSRDSLFYITHLFRLSVSSLRVPLLPC